MRKYRTPGDEADTKKKATLPPHALNLPRGEDSLGKQKKTGAKTNHPRSKKKIARRPGQKEENQGKKITEKKHRVANVA